MTSIEKESTPQEPTKEEFSWFSLGMWRFWLGVIVLVAWIVGAQIESSSETAQNQRDQALQRATKSVYEDTLDSCTGENAAICRSQAAYDAQKARNRLAPIVGK